jgi:hypothetical protein
MSKNTLNLWSESRTKSVKFILSSQTNFIAPNFSKLFRSSQGLRIVIRPCQHILQSESSAVSTDGVSLASRPTPQYFQMYFDHQCSTFIVDSAHPLQYSIHFRHSNGVAPFVEQLTSLIWFPIGSNSLDITPALDVYSCSEAFDAIIQPKHDDSLVLVLILSMPLVSIASAHAIRCLLANFLEKQHPIPAKLIHQ